MKQSMYFLVLALCVTLSSCGMYVGNPPKTEVHDTTTTVPAEEMHVYTD